jgi:hypothetical protein
LGHLRSFAGSRGHLVHLTCRHCSQTVAVGGINGASHLWQVRFTRCLVGWCASSLPALVVMVSTLFFCSFSVVALVFSFSSGPFFLGMRGHFLHRLCEHFTHTFSEP